MALGLNQTQFSELTRIPVQVLSRLEHGLQSVYVERLADMAKALDCSADYLLGLTDAPRPRRKRPPAVAGEEAAAGEVGVDLDAYTDLELLDLQRGCARLGDLARARQAGAELARRRRAARAAAADADKEEAAQAMDNQDFHAALTSLLDQVRWTPIARVTDPGEEPTLPYATHEGVLSVPGLGSLPVYQLNTGERVFDGETVARLLGLDEPGEDVH
jgi:transcriptional regulator with XRE-family HTH domain